MFNWKLLVGSVAALSSVGGVVGVLMSNRMGAWGEKMSYLIANINKQDLGSEDPSSKLFKDNLSNYTCSFSHASITNNPLKGVECEVYSITDNDGAKPDLSNIQPPKNKVTSSEGFKSSSATGSTYYQISIKDDDLQKLAPSHYKGVEIKLVPNGETESEDSKYISFTSHFGFREKEIYGQARNVIVKIDDKNPSNSEKVDHHYFTLDGVSGYKLIELENSGSSSIQTTSEIKTSHVQKYKQGSKKQLKFSEVEKDKFYILMSPNGKPFDLTGIKNKKIVLNCNCSGNIKATIVKFLTNIPKTKTK